jgi:hypothetical protein
MTTENLAIRLFEKLLKYFILYLNALFNIAVGCILFR